MKKFLKLLFVIPFIFLLSSFSACQEEKVYSPIKEIAVVLLNGEHYSVVGNNKQIAKKGDTIVFEINIERGYRAVSSFGDDCVLSDNLSFKQTVTFSNVNYNMTAQIETEEIPVWEFGVVCDVDMGEIELKSLLGSASEDLYYDCDVIDLSAVPKDGNRFICWSTDNYIVSGGSFYGYDSVIEDIDFATVGKLYANFKDITNTKNTLVYSLGNGIEIEQDCSIQVEHHYRANTYTAVDMRANGIDCDSRYLVGWNTAEGEYVGLGSRVATADKEVVLFPVWKEYTSEKDFTINNGVLTRFSGTLGNDGAVVIPNRVNGEKVTAIGENAFKDCLAKTYYIPDTVETIEDNAFMNCTSLKEVYMSDNIMNITDSAFKGCANFETLHLNAFIKPKHIKEQVSVVSDNYDRLALNADSGVRKVVVLGGSGAQAGYSCSVISEMFADIGETVDVYNFGWSAAYCGLAQFEVINHYLREGDIFLHAPEHYEGVLCGAEGTSPITGERGIALSGIDPYFYRLAESNYEYVSLLTVNEYSNLFSMLATFNRNRYRMADCEYSDYFNGVNEEEYGYKSTNEQVLEENGTDKSFGGARDILPLASCFELTKKYMYEKLPSGVLAYVTFPAVNRSNLLLTYGNEETVKAVSDEYTKQVKGILKDMNLQILLTQYDTVYDGRYFFNHDYHLGHPSRNAHTQKVIAALIGSLKMGGA